MLLPRFWVADDNIGAIEVCYRGEELPARLKEPTDSKLQFEPLQPDIVRNYKLQKESPDRHARNHSQTTKTGACNHKTSKRRR
jgi:hypothetical protein